MKKIKKNELETFPTNQKIIEPVRTFKGKEMYDVNPFIETIIIQTRNKSQIIGKNLVVTDQDGMELSMSTVSAYKKVDTQEFLKVFAATYTLMMGLSPFAYKTLIIFMYAITYDAIGKDVVFLPYSKAEKYMEEINAENNGKKIKITQSEFSKGVRQLIANNLIAANNNGDGWYFINPNYIFNGDRVAFLQIYEKKKKEKEIQAQGSLLELNKNNNDPF